MTKEVREQVNAIVENLSKIHDQIWKEFYHSEQPQKQDYFERREDLRTKIKGRNIIDFSTACSNLGEAIRHLENTIFRELTD